MRRYGFLGLVLVVLVAVYLATLQTIPNGSDHYFMIDVGETQIVLNTWGTLHPTGYPHYVITGNLLTTLLTLLGSDPAVAAALVSVLWGLLALSALYALALRLTNRALAAGLTVLLYGLTRTVWIHHTIAEIYTFGLLLTILLYLIALWPLKNRFYWLALIGGLSVAHHRAAITLMPALLYAVWPDFVTHRRRLPRMLLISLGLGLLGLLPYLYLPLRAGADWVYGTPATWAGFWEQFLASEYTRYIGPPPSLSANLALVNNVLLTDLTVPGLVLGLIGLGLAVRTPRHRTAALTLILGGLGAYIFHVAFYNDVLSALILQVTLSMAFGWLFLMDWVLTQMLERGAILSWRPHVTGRMAVALVAGLLSLLLLVQNAPFIRSLTSDPTGLETIELARQVPPGSTLMIPWGMRYFAVGLAQSVYHDLPGLTLVDHSADFATIAGSLVAPDYVFYNYPVTWWQERLGTAVFLRAAGPGLVEIATEPLETETDLPEPINVVNQTLTCTANRLTLTVDWATAEVPETDYSVFVHLLDASSQLIAQADQSAPVYGWRPVTSWQAAEIVRDVYTLPRPAHADRIRYGLYRQLDDGAFQNDYEYTVAVNCDE